jgi:uncharacterized protein (UPF0332 family)
MNSAQHEEIQQYMTQAQYMLSVAQDNLEADHFGSSINRSYYAVFYAASALLSAIGEARAKHQGVLGAFRQHFIKNGLWSVEFSHIYGRILADRERSDYDIFLPVSHADAEVDLQDARRFVAEAEKWLAGKGWL